LQTSPRRRQFLHAWQTLPRQCRRRLRLCPFTGVCVAYFTLSMTVPPCIPCITHLQTSPPSTAVSPCMTDFAPSTPWSSQTSPPFTGGCVADLTPSISVPLCMSDVANRRQFLVHVRLHPVDASSSMHDTLCPAVSLYMSNFAPLTPVPPWLSYFTPLTSSSQTSPITGACVADFSSK